MAKLQIFVEDSEDVLKRQNPGNLHQTGIVGIEVDSSGGETLSLSSVRGELLALGKLQKQALLAVAYNRMAVPHQAAYDRRRERIGEMPKVL